MDLTKFDTREAADEGRPMHLKHPIFGHPLYTGDGADDQGRLVNRRKGCEPILLHVRGFHSETVRSLIRKGQKDALTGDAEDKGDALIDALIVGWSDNVTDADGQPRKCDKRNKVAVIRSNDEYEAQLLAFARDQANFFGAPAKG